MHNFEQLYCTLDCKYIISETYVYSSINFFRLRMRSCISLQNTSKETLDHTFIYTHNSVTQTHNDIVYVPRCRWLRSTASGSGENKLIHLALFFILHTYIFNYFRILYLYIAHKILLSPVYYLLWAHNTRMLKLTTTY